MNVDALVVGLSLIRPQDVHPGVADAWSRNSHRLVERVSQGLVTEASVLIHAVQGDAFESPQTALRRATCQRGVIPAQVNLETWLLVEWTSRTAAALGPNSDAFKSLAIDVNIANVVVAFVRNATWRCGLKSRWMRSSPATTR